MVMYHFDKKSNMNDTGKLDILFPSNHNIHKSSCCLCFLASDPLIDRFYLKFKSKGHKNFYEFCDLTEKVYLRRVDALIIMVFKK